MFRRRKNEEAEEVVEAPEVVDESTPELARPQGPWDHADAPEDEVNRIDLGGLQVPVPSETEVRVDVSPEGEVVAATLVRGATAMQVNAFAAPRRAGIWGEVRDEIAGSLRETGGQAENADGPYGLELHAQVPAEGGFAPARFLGVDGPRWFLRALITGPGATDPSVAEPLLTALKDVVVVRGGEAMAVRDPLPLRLPKEVTAAAAASAEEEGEQDAAPLPPPERGPEITEIR